MDENIESAKQEELKRWIKKQLDVAVRKSMKQGGVDGLIVEAKPAWVLPFQVLLGKIRPQGQASGSQWCICGEVPTDFLQAGIASTPREALKHFSMKWQLAAARHQEVNLKRPAQDDPAGQLAVHAEEIYALVEDDRLWTQD